MPLTMAELLLGALRRRAPWIALAAGLIAGAAWIDHRAYRSGEAACATQEAAR